MSPLYIKLAINDSNSSKSNSLSHCFNNSKHISNLIIYGLPARPAVSYKSAE